MYHLVPLNERSATSSNDAASKRAGKQPTIADRTAAAKLSQRGPARKIIAEMKSHEAASTFIPAA